MTNTKNQTKVLIIFPKLDSDTSTHYHYWHKLFKSCEKNLDIVYIDESKQSRVRRILSIYKYIRQDYRNIYCHYGYFSVLLASMFRPFFRLKIFLWDCEYYQSKPNNLLLHIALKKCDVLATGSHMIGEQYRKIFQLGRKPIKIVPNYVEPIKAKKLHLSPKYKHILFVHWLSPRKGSRELPEIIKLSVKANPALRYIIIGTGPDEKWLKQELSTYMQYVNFLGKQPNSIVISYMKSCDIFIMPSRSEGFPRVILEAMLYKIPFVATNVGNVTEIVSTGQKSFLVPPADPDLFSKTLIKLHHFSNKSKIIEANFRQVMLNYKPIHAKKAFNRVF